MEWGAEEGTPGRGGAYANPWSPMLLEERVREVHEHEAIVRLRGAGAVLRNKKSVCEGTHAIVENLDGLRAGVGPLLPLLRTTGQRPLSAQRYVFQSHRHVPVGLLIRQACPTNLPLLCSDLIATAFSSLCQHVPCLATSCMNSPPQPSFHTLLRPALHRHCVVPDIAAIILQFNPLEEQHDKLCVTASRCLMLI